MSEQQVVQLATQIADMAVDCERGVIAVGRDADTGEIVAGVALVGPRSIEFFGKLTDDISLVLNLN